MGRRIVPLRLFYHVLPHWLQDAPLLFTSIHLRIKTHHCDHHGTFYQGVLPHGKTSYEPSQDAVAVSPSGLDPS